MNISKAKLETLVDELPNEVDIEEVMYRLYLLEKIENGERDIQEGKTFSHIEVREKLSAKWQK